MDFKFKIYAPTLEQYIHFKEFNNEQYLNIVKSIVNNDNEQLYRLFKELIADLSSDDLVNKLSRIDMFCILLNLYILCVSSELEISKKEDGPVGKSIIKLYDILDIVTNYEIKYDVIVKISPDISITITPPKNLYVSQPDLIIVDCVSKIKILKDWFDLSEYNHEQKIKVIDDLPGEVLQNIIQSMQSVNDEYQLKVVKYGILPNETITLSMYNDSMFELLKIIYNTNLQNEYSLRYFMAKHINISITEYNMMSPAESRTYLKLFQKEQDEHKKEQEKHSKQNGNMHLGAPIS